MLQIIKRIWLSLLLLGAGAATLLLSDLHSREGAEDDDDKGNAPIQVALLKHASNQLLDDVERGAIEQLAAAGYRDGERIALQRFCAEGDLPTANAIAKRITDGSFRMVLTISTLSLQCVANANQSGRTIHVFAGVTDPAGSGVGIKRMNSNDKPRWLAGFGTFQPVEQIFNEAKRSYPALKTVGVVWNPAERNSEICTVKAREVSARLGIKLLEATVDQSKDVREAADSLVARGAEAFWTGADVTVLNAVSALCESAAKAKIPVFSNSSGQVRDGSLFDLGANYVEVGQRLGGLAASILDGLDPAAVEIVNFMPERVMLNKQVQKKLREPWHFPPDMVERAALIIGEDGKIEKEVKQTAAASAASSAPLTGRNFKIALAYFGPDEGTDTCIKGLLDGLAKQGAVEGKNLTVQKAHASGEIGNIPAMLQSLDASPIDAIVTFSTPVLVAACVGVKDKPVVFTYCSDPLAAKAGRSFEDHLPHVTGIGSFPPVEEGLSLIRQTIPNVKRLGAIYNNAEANSVKVVSVLRELCEKQGIELIEGVANNTSEVVPAAQGLASRQIQAVYLPGDNTAYQAFEGLATQFAKSKIPLVIDAPEYGDREILAVVGIGFYQSGYAASESLTRVLCGESPARVPFRNVADKQVILNQRVADKLGLKFPPKVLEMQTKKPSAAPAPAPSAKASRPATKKWRIQMISYSESAMVEEATEGFQDALREVGLVAGKDFTTGMLSAQGDMATLGSLFDSARTAGTDLYLTFSTPTLQTALQKVKEVPVVFTVVADPFIVGAGKSDTDHLANVTGVYTQGPYRELAEVLRDYFPKIKKVGTLFCPAEVNSVLNRDVLVKEATRCGLTVETVAANSSSELADASVSLCSRKLDAVVQIVDNLSVVGFPTIARAAAQAKLPLFTTMSAGVKHGAVLALARDYYDAGREAGLKAAEVMRGVNPAEIPFSPPMKLQKVVSLKNAELYQLTIPPALLSQFTPASEASSR
jgi:ABC-type uncharacterized transport system substrate-binding protein